MTLTNVFNYIYLYKYIAYYSEDFTQNIKIHIVRTEETYPYMKCDYPSAFKKELQKSSQFHLLIKGTRGQ